MIRPVVAAVCLALVASACAADPEPRRVADRPVEPGTTRSTPAPPPVPEPVQRSLLSGRKGRADRPIYAVKVDNTAAARPQVGLARADIVYIEQVEGGVTRLAAVFSSAYPRRVGPVRSARITDIELLRQFGRVGLIYSGSQRKLADNLRRAKLRLLAYDNSSRGYRRAGNRPRPYDVIGKFPALRKRAGKVSTPRKRMVGWSFGPAPKGGREARHVRLRYPTTRVDARWKPGKGRWWLSIDGRLNRVGGGVLGPSTFVIQFTRVTPSVYRDVNGANTPMTHTVGKGRALIFRDGRVYQGRWSRPKAKAATVYQMRGRRAVFAPGQIWVALLKRNSPVDVS
jgi:hypothetical protein